MFGTPFHSLYTVPERACHPITMRFAILLTLSYTLFASCSLAITLHMPANQEELEPFCDSLVLRIAAQLTPQDLVKWRISENLLLSAVTRPVWKNVNETVKAGIRSVMHIEPGSSEDQEHLSRNGEKVEPCLASLPHVDRNVRNPV